MKDRIQCHLPLPNSLTLMGLSLSIPFGAVLAQAPDSSAEAQPDPVGMSVSFDPSLSVSVGYSDNIFSTRNAKIADGMTIVSPELKVSVDGNPFSFTLFGEAEVGRYMQEQSEDYDDFKLGFDGDWQLKAQSRLFGGANYSRDHEDRQSPNDVDGLQPTLYDRTEAYGGYSARHGSWITRFGVTFEDLDYDDVPGRFGLIENDDRDRKHLSVGARLGRLVSPGHTIFVQGAYGEQDYKLDTDQYGFDRNSSGGDLVIGYGYQRGRLAKSEIAVGLLNQEYDDPGFGNIQTLDVLGTLEWLPSPGSRVSGTLSRTLLETTLPFSSAILETRAQASFRKAINTRLSFVGSLSLSHDDYMDVPQRDYIARATLGARYQLSGLAYGGFRFGHAQRDSNNPHSDYDENSLYIYLGSGLNPSLRDKRFDQPLASNGALATGFYGGIEGLFANIHSELEGPRGGTGTLTSDFGDHGFGGAPFAGYAFKFDNWLMALEVDATLQDTHWDHDNAPAGRLFTVKADESYGLSALMGHANESGVTYGRFGYRQGVFETRYTHSGTMSYQQNRLGGLRVGVGGEIKTTPTTFLRLDYSRTAFEDDDIDFGSDVDNFASSLSEVRLGFGYRPGARRSNSVKEAPETLYSNRNGIYGGVQAGAASLTSQISGPRKRGNILDASYADDGGLIRGFFGYEWSLDKVSLALEIEGDTGNVSPQLERAPSGRDISIYREVSAGLGLRLGYRFDHGGQIFLRAGPVVTNFRTEYETSGDKVVSDDNENGVRYGLGVEIPIANKLSVRFDTTYTEYDDYTIEYGTANEDNFTNDETLFLVGLSYRY